MFVNISVNKFAIYSSVLTLFCKKLSYCVTVKIVVPASFYFAFPRSGDETENLFQFPPSTAI